MVGALLPTLALFKIALHLEEARPPSSNVMVLMMRDVVSANTNLLRARAFL